MSAVLCNLSCNLLKLIIPRKKTSARQLLGFKSFQMPGLLQYQQLNLTLTQCCQELPGLSPTGCHPCRESPLLGLAGSGGGCRHSREPGMPDLPPALPSSPATGTGRRSSAGGGLCVAAGFFSACPEPLIPPTARREAALPEQNSSARASPEPVLPTWRERAVELLACAEFLHENVCENELLLLVNTSSS